MSSPIGLQKKMSPEEMERQIVAINEYIKGQKENPNLVDHFHDGFDTSYVNYSNIAGKKIYLPHTIIGADAATAANYGVFWTVPVACTITGVSEVHQVLGTDGSAVTVGLEKLTGTQAPAAGVAVLATEFDLKAAINTVQYGVLSETLSSRSLIKGDRLALEDTGTLTSVSNITVIVELTMV